MIHELPVVYPMNIIDKSHSQEEQNLVNSLLKRDKEVIKSLYERYSAAIYGIISNVIPDEEAAKETLQDVFMKIWNNGDKYDATKGRLFTWMVQIARNVAIDTLRSSQFKKGSKTESLPNFVSNNAAHSEVQRERDSALRRVVHQLDESNRNIIELLYFEDYTQKEVSEELGIPLGTVKSRVRKAITQLREMLGDEKLMMLGGAKLVDLIIQHFGH
jgi:RNA polymerase sigma-70 factor (ECF subfamily)